MVHLNGRYDPGQNVVTFPQDDGLSLREPGLEFAGIAKLAHVDIGHDLNVTQNVSHSQVERILQTDLTSQTRNMSSIGAGVYELKEADERAWYRVIYLSDRKQDLRVALF